MTSKITKDSVVGSYVYTFACHENERALCELELGTMLVPGTDLDSRDHAYVRSDRCIPPGEVLLSGAGWM